MPLSMVSVSELRDSSSKSHSSLEHRPVRVVSRVLIVDVNGYRPFWSFRRSHAWSPASLPTFRSHADKDRKGG